MRSEPHPPLPPNQPPATGGNTEPFDWSTAPGAVPVPPTGQPTEVLPAVDAGQPPLNPPIKRPEVTGNSGGRATASNRSKGHIVLAAVLATGLAVAAAVPWLRGTGSHEDRSQRVGDTPAGLEAGPAPEPSVAPEGQTPQVAPTVTSVDLRPSASGAASTTVTVAGGSEKPAATTSTTLAGRPETITAPEKRYLPADEVQKIITATKYEGLAGHRFEITEEFTTSAAKYVVVNIDGAQPAVSIDALKADIAKAEAEAASRPAFSARIKLGPGVTRSIGFKAGPAKLTRDGADTRYIMYADTELDSLTAPVKGFPDSSTISLPYKHLNVSLIKLHGAKATVDGVPANRFYTAVEANQTAMAFDIDSQSEQQLDQERPDMSYVSGSSDYLQQKLALANIGREIYTNSLAYAEECARAGVPYAQYKAQAEKIPLRAYPQADVYYITLGEAQYGSLA